MNERYEFIEYLEGLPIRVYLHSVRSFPFHWHQELEILMSIKGSFYVEYKGKMMRIKEGDLVVIGPNIIHATNQTEEPNQVIALQINCEEISVRKMYEACLSSDFECVGNPGDNPAIDIIRRSLCSIALEVYYKNTGYLYTVSAHVQMILGALMSHFTKEPEPGKMDVRSSSPERILRILDYINENYTQRITLQNLASREFVGTNYLSAYIKKNLGMTLSDYLNSIRLRKYHEYLQTDFTTPINDIAYKSGFSSPQYAASLFSRKFNITPGKFRREIQKQTMIMEGALESIKHGSYMDTFPELDVSLIMKYLQVQSQPELPRTAAECFFIEVDCAQAASAQYFGSTVRVTTIGRAYEGLLSHVQRQLMQLQEEIGFSYVRFHGLMSDDMMMIKADTDGDIQYNFFLVDQLLDFLLSIRLKPFLELTFMPSILASGNQTVFSWRANITPPASLGQWRDLVRALMSHLVSRYGTEEVSQWYFEVWNEPDLTDISWTGTQQEFFRFYVETAKTIESILPQARIVGPSITSVGIKSKKWVRAFMRYCELHQAPVHAFSLHLYSEIVREDNLALNVRRIAKSTTLLEQSPSLMERDYVKNLLDNLRGQLGQKYQKLPLIATEWNLSLSMFNPIHDSAFAGTSLIYDSLKNDSDKLLLLHWTGLDYLEEAIPLPVQEFHGGFGLLTVNGLRKPTYWAMWALSKLGKEVLEKNDYGILTRKGDELVLLTCHHPLTEFAYDISYAKPFSISSSQMMEIHEYQWKLILQATDLRIQRYHFMLDHSDSKKVMADMKVQEPLGVQSINQIKMRAQPEYSEENISCENGQLSIRCMLRKCEFELIIISRRTN
ncbi:MAG TPA: helix-turn-helix domain-containing protein [Clostridia bacterium]|nr:helix-turn-helix domain-containing protein [Clostridia bacterium]